ncbi:MAG: lysophospholipid acyltransferase family protein [Wenzhouxiangellaceae bacterium]|nr:lysophospholipid acyltransferase family protein [Wenzhouxiangellaceae bacterium]
MAQSPLRRVRRAAAQALLPRLTGWAVRGGPERIRNTGNRLGRLHYVLTRPAQTGLIRDIAHALELPRRRAADALIQAYRGNDRGVFEILCMADPTCDIDGLLAHLQIHQLERLEADAAAAGGLLLGMHMGNGILMASALARRGLPVHVVFRDPRRLPPGLLGRAIEHGGATPIALDRANPTRSFRQMLKVLRDGGLIYVLMDQANKGEGSPRSFLGKRLNMPNGVPGLAVRTGAPVWPVLAEAAWPDWIFRVHPPLVAETADALLDGICATMEHAIRSHPDLWAWHHRRWKRYPFITEPSV